MKQLLLFAVASIIFTGCAGGDANLDPEYIPDAPKTHITDANAEATIKKADTSLYSIGVIDTGLHVDRLDSHVIPVLYNEEHERDLLEGHEWADWVWNFASHGTAVADTASRYAKNSSIVFAMHRRLGNWQVQTDDFREREFTNTTIKVIPGEQRIDGIPFDRHIIANDRGECVRGISVAYDNDDKCLSHATYWIKEILLAPANPVVAINMSFGASFLFSANSIFTNGTMEEWEKRNAYEAWENGDLRPAGGMKGHGDRTELRRLLAENDVVLVHASGNDKENLTEVADTTFYLTLKSQDHDGSFSTLVNNFYDFDHDDNGNGVIESDERGVTEAYIAVGGGRMSHVNDGGKFERNPYSAYPGEDKNIQSRFIMANWEVSAKDAYSEDEWDFGGTSFSAPQVTGAIVLLKSLFPLKTAREIAQAILDSGNKNFKDYNPELHGQGFLDVGAAELLLLEE